MMPAKSIIKKTITVEDKYIFDLEIYPRLISWEIYPKDHHAALYAFSNKDKLNKLIEDEHVFEKKDPGKEVVTTGIKVDLVEPLLETVGATIGNGVKAETAVVVVRDDPTYSSGKTKKAEKLNIPMMTIDEFTSKYFPA